MNAYLNPHVLRLKFTIRGNCKHFFMDVLILRNSDDTSYGNVLHIY